MICKTVFSFTLHFYFLLPTLFPSFPLLPSPSFSFSFLVSFDLLCPNPSAVPWIVVTASSLASLRPPDPLFYCPHGVSFHHLNQNLLLPCATPSSGFSSHSEPRPARLCGNCFLADSLTCLIGNFQACSSFWAFYFCSSLSFQIAADFILTSSGLCPHVTLSDRPALMTLHKIAIQLLSILHFIFLLTYH